MGDEKTQWAHGQRLLWVSGCTAIGWCIVNVGNLLHSNGILIRWGRAVVLTIGEATEATGVVF